MLSISLGAFYVFSTVKTSNLIVGTNKLTVETAKTSEQMQRGLCCRDSLAQHAGMLFVYEKPGDYRFWMKDTKIALDMYWINSQKKIVYIEHNVQPSSYPKTFGTEIPAQYILETNAGYAKSRNIKIGDAVNFNSNH